MVKAGTINQPAYAALPPVRERPFVTADETQTATEVPVRPLGEGDRLTATMTGPPQHPAPRQTRGLARRGLANNETE